MRCLALSDATSARCAFRSSLLMQKRSVLAERLSLEQIQPFCTLHDHSALAMFGRMGVRHELPSRTAILGTRRR
jgi:hypothetical protein